MNRDEKLIREARRLPREIEPPRDLWPGIEARLRDERATGRVIPGDFRVGGRTLIAAAAVLLVVLAALAGLRGSGSGSRVAEAPRPDAAALERLDAEYATTSRAILDGLGRDGTLDPETVETIRRNLEIIDDAVREIRAALEEDPSSPVLSSLLNAEHQRRGALLRRAARLRETI